MRSYSASSLILISGFFRLTLYPELLREYSEPPFGLLRAEEEFSSTLKPLELSGRKTLSQWLRIRSRPPSWSGYCPDR